MGAFGILPGMGKRVITETFSDLSGERDAQTITIGWQGYEFTVDLTSHEVNELAKMLRPYLEAGKRSRKRVRPTSTGHGSRAWAQHQAL